MPRRPIGEVAMTDAERQRRRRQRLREARPLRCMFCDRTQDEVRGMWSDTATRKMICDRCTAKAVKAIGAQKAKRKAVGRSR